ncbi:hypothetical protein H311_01442 [Anncaliia algerae PRA109]|nr:hypothetical protein H311_01442 [Anncaliia algerae PRA109]
MIIDKVVTDFPETKFENEKFSAPGFIIQIDETMLNFKCKDHRGRLPQNKTDGLCIVEVGNQITRAFATVIENKKSEHIMPIICSQVASESIVWTDEHKS